MSIGIAALIALAAISAVYFFCMRPMRSGGCGMSGAPHDAELDRQIADLREELRLLRSQDSLEPGSTLADRPIPPIGG